ncbi:hypothetical protein EV126DRAFT_164263 [Verticillium dahliae]|nr:hypothetical protein EV126DRAFT_164263 [Verticillium dahliae]
MPARRRGITGHSYTFRPSRARPAGNAWSPAEQLSHSGPGMPNTALGTSDSPRAHEQQERNEHQGHDAQHRSPRSCLARRKKRKQISGYERLGTPHLPLAGVLVGGWAVQECQHSEKTRHATQGRCVGGRRSKRGRNGSLGRLCTMSVFSCRVVSWRMEQSGSCFVAADGVRTGRVWFFVSSSLAGFR